ncbi:MAG: hypothetical protein LAT80_12030 [Balneolaceae bacterium]|nr:hypothetical protein [Balneolaceae bacterium]
MEVRYNPRKSLYPVLSLIIIILMSVACDTSVTDGLEEDDENEIEDLSCIVNGFSAVDNYIALWENCEDEAQTDRLHRITLQTPDGEIRVQVSDTSYSSYAPAIWREGDQLMIAYAENQAEDNQNIVHYTNRIVLKSFTMAGSPVSETTLMEVEPGGFGTFQLPVRVIERGDQSFVVYWADNEVEEVTRAIHLFDIESGEDVVNLYLTGIRSANTPYAALNGDKFVFAFMSILSLEEEAEQGVDADENSIFIVETDQNFQPIGDEQLIHIGGDSDLGFEPSVTPVGDNFGVVFMSNETVGFQNDRLNIRLFDPEEGEVIYSEVSDQFSYLNHQTIADDNGYLYVFYIESDSGYSATEFNLRVTVLNSETLEADDQSVMTVSNPNFELERLNQNEVRLYYGESSDRIVSTELSLDSFGN